MVGVRVNDGLAESLKPFKIRECDSWLEELKIGVPPTIESRALVLAN